MICPLFQRYVREELCGLGDEDGGDEKDETRAGGGFHVCRVDAPFDAAAFGVFFFRSALFELFSYFGEGCFAVCTFAIIGEFSGDFVLETGTGVLDG